MTRFTYRQNILDAMPGTATQIAEKSGCNIRTVRGLLSALRSENLIHVVSWTPTTDYTRWIEVHGVGPGENVGKPKLLPEAPAGMRQRERRTCYCCGDQFDVFASDAAAGAGKFCSTECKNMGVGPQSIVLDCLPGTSEELAHRSGLDQKHAMQAVGRLIAKDIVHYAGLVPAPAAPGGKKQKRFVMLYALGPKTDPNVPRRMWDATGYFYRQMILAVMPGTKKQIIQRTSMDPATALKHVDALHAEGLCHIKRWRKARTKGHHMAVYQPGPGQDAPDDIQPMTMQERYEKFRSKPGRIEEMRASQREYMRIRRLRTKKGDPLFNALYGTPAQRRQKSQEKSHE